MARTASERHRRGLVAELTEKHALASPRVRAAFLSVARERFLPDVLAEGGLKAIYRDEAIVTKRNAQGMPLSSSSQPALMAKMLELLDVRPGDRVLEIGTGTGYNAALLAQLAGPSGRVTTIDIDRDLARRARRSLRDAGVRATVVVGDGRHGHAPKAPYDRIIATAAADGIPRAWLEQLSDGGRVELPLRLDPDRGALQLIPVLERRGEKLRSVGLTWGGFMPLHGGDGGWSVAPRANLSATYSANGKHTGLASLTGDGVARLSLSTARSLLVALLGGPREARRRGVIDMASDSPPLLLLYLYLNIATGRRLQFTRPGRWGIGLVDSRGTSSAIVSLRSPWSTENHHRERRRARWRLDAYGPDTAANELDRLVNRWRDLERAGENMLQITTEGDDDPLRVSFAWTKRTGDL